VSPLSRNTNVLKHGKNVYQIIPPFKVQIDKNSNYISKKHKNEKILILAKKEEEKYAKQYKSFLEKRKEKLSFVCLMG